MRMFHTYYGTKALHSRPLKMFVRHCCIRLFGEGVNMYIKSLVFVLFQTCIFVCVIINGVLALGTYVISFPYGMKNV